jgi:hypothetical protein
MSASRAHPDEPTLCQRYRSASVWLCTAVLVACAIAFIVATRHWPMVGDAAQMHYTVFLIRHGWIPYRDFLDVNMPGAYLVTAIAMHLPGPEDLSWRFFDLTLVAATGIGYLMIARPYSRFAALFATVLLLLVHGQDGVQQAGQRDLVIAALTTLAVAFLLEATRKQRWTYLLPFGLFTGLAATIKPTALPLGIAILALAALRRVGWWRSGTEEHASSARTAFAWVGAGIAGMILPVMCMMLWLHHHSALEAWVTTQRILLPYYAQLGHRAFAFTLSHSLSPVLPLVLLWLLFLMLRWLEGRRAGAHSVGWPVFERLVITVAVLFSLLGLLLQGKALPYQRYPMLALLLLLIALDLTTGLRQRGMACCAGLAGLVCGCLVLVPIALVRVSRFDAKPQEFDAMLTADLRSVGGDLNGRVQCLDTIQECLPTLYTMRLIPATRTLYDTLLFGPSQQPAVQRARRIFLAEIERRPPSAIVVVSGFFLDGTGGYRKLDAWPGFEQWMNAHYVLAANRTPPHMVRWWSRPQPPASYRLYVRRRDDVASPAEALR